MILKTPDSNIYMQRDEMSRHRKKDRRTDNGYTFVFAELPELKLAKAT